MPKKLNFSKQEQYEVPTPKAVYNFKVYLIALMGTAAGLDYGYDLGFIGTTQALKPYVTYFGLAKDAAYATSYKSNVVALFQAGAIVGSLIVGPISSWTGRKPINIAVAALFILGSVIQSVAGLGGSNPNAMMLGGRFVNGVSVGASNALAPYIVSEMSPPAIRGRLVGLYEVGVQMGTLLGFWVNYGLTRHHPVNNMLWRIPFILQLIFGGLYLFGSIFVPESPRYLAKRGREAMMRSLAYIRHLPMDDTYLNIEGDEIMQQYEAEQALPGWKGFIKELRVPSIRNRFLSITGLFIFFQFSGTNSVNYYSPTIFKRLGITGQSVSFLATGIYGVIRFIAILVAMLWAVDRFGRKTLLIVFAGIMALCMWIIGALVKTETGGVAAPLVLIYIYAASFCFSFAGIPNIINVEIWPARMRPYGVSWGVFVHWVFNLVIGKATPYMVESLDYGFFFLYAAFLTCSCFFTYFFIPETRGVPLERIEELFGGSPALVEHEGIVRRPGHDSGSYVSERKEERSEIEEKA